MTDILYVAFNRLEMTRESFQALLDNTNWDLVQRLYIADDKSTDGTLEWLQEASKAVESEVTFSRRKLGGPVSATNWYLTESKHRYLLDQVDRFVKLDNDFVVCPGWLDELLRQATLHAEIDIFGIEPMLGPATMPPFEGRYLREARHIGGKGLIRHRCFDVCHPTPTGRNGYFGFTEWQLNHEDVRKAWVAPDLPCFGLDQLGWEPWLSLTDQYVEKGWQRRWPTYPLDGTADAYWDWWTPVHLEKEMQA